ncbi:MAG TPA: response regulator [Ktedonobacteraceae bacterium]|jgi:DNA-binding NtrC family response regulator|nr:response regulator [Ktedonobacteraceae bacterium]
MTACILVINDQPAILDLYYDLLNSDDYELELSDYTFETLQTIERLNPTLIILDFPVLNRARVWQLLDQLKMHLATASIPLILCSAARSDVREQEDYLQQQGIVIYYKPFHPEAFIQTVQQMIHSPIRKAC